MRRMWQTGYHLEHAKLEVGDNLISVAESHLHQGRKHLLEDIQPYDCLFLCQYSSQPLKNRMAWLSHFRTQHSQDLSA